MSSHLIVTKGLEEYMSALQLDQMKDRVIETLRSEPSWGMSVKELKRKVIRDEDRDSGTEEARFEKRRHRIWRKLRTKIVGEGLVVEEDKTVFFSGGKHTHRVKYATVPG